MSELKARLLSDMKSAMKAGEKERLGVIRLMMAAVKQREVDDRVELSDEEVVGVLDRMVKQRRESIAQYDAAGRIDLSEVEKAEIDVIQTYLPQPLTASEVDDLINSAIANTGASGISGMGKVMAVIKAPMQGRADMTVVSARVKSLLGV
ncbi:MAG: GatB/YqeY domain-containing protein [Methylococcaceae bacterium]|jgi:uncharacterized protein YqeY|nr:GatB/YqeY domain-containing protein [Methylococcaceae bacterium]